MKRISQDVCKDVSIEFSGASNSADIWSKHVKAIIIGRGATKIERFAVRIIRKKIENTLGYKPKIMIEKHWPAIKPGKYILLGTSATNYLLKNMVEKKIIRFNERSVQNKESFILRNMQDGKKTAFLLVYGNNPIGTLWGAYELEARIIKNGFPLLNIIDKPLLSYRFGGLFDIPYSEKKMVKALRMRINACIPLWALTTVQEVLIYQKFPEVYDAKNRTEKLKIIRANQKKAHEQLWTLKEHGLSIFAWSYEPSLPLCTWNPKYSKEYKTIGEAWAKGVKDYSKTNFFKVHPEAMATPIDRSHIFCPSSPTTKSFVQAKYEELFETFPQFDGLFLTLADDASLLCECARCKKYPLEKRIIDYTRLIYNTVKKINPQAKIVLREWGMSAKGWYKNISLNEIKKSLPADLNYDIKWSAGRSLDFSWQSPLSTYIGQIPNLFVDTGYSEPDAAYPLSHLCCLFQKFKKHYTEFVKNGVIATIGVFNVCNTDDVLWELNGFGQARCVWNPNTFNPEKVLREWATKRFAKNAGKFICAAFKDVNKITDALLPEYSYTSLFLYKEERLKDITRKTAKGWLKRVNIAEVINITKNTEKNLNRALTILPGDAGLKRLWVLSKATIALSEFFKNYHTSLIYYRLFQNLKQDKDKTRSVEYCNEASKDATAYAKYMRIFIKHKDRKLIDHRNCRERWHVRTVLNSVIILKKQLEDADAASSLKGPRLHTTR